MSAKPRSLPPMVSVTTSVESERLADCTGALAPVAVTCSTSRMFAVTAPLQVRSSSVRPSDSAMRCG